MTELDGIVGVWEMGYAELDNAFSGLGDDKLWVRPAENLLSIGELAGHIAFTEAVGLTGPGPNFDLPLDTVPVKSWLLQNNFKYLPKSLADPPSEDVRKKGAAETLRELKRVHAESVAHVRSSGLELDDQLPGWEFEVTLRWCLHYAAFHVSYHLGQMYTVRHLLGDSTPDN